MPELVKAKRINTLRKISRLKVVSGYGFADLAMAGTG
jgi:hypothetical protein